MKIEAKQIETGSNSNSIGRFLSEPFLVVGLALFWAIALPVTAVFFALLAVVEPALIYLRAARLALRVSPRMTRSAA